MDGGMANERFGPGRPMFLDAAMIRMQRLTSVSRYACDATSGARTQFAFQ
jgi:hypothetical protein